MVNRRRSTGTEKMDGVEELREKGREDGEEGKEGR